MQAKDIMATAVATVRPDAGKRVARIAAENVPGVKGVRDEIGVLPPSVRSVMWAE